MDIRIAWWVSRWDGTTNLVVSEVERIGAKVAMPTAHDWY